MRPCLGRNKPLPAGRDEGAGVADDVIGGERQHHGVVVARLRKGRAGGDRRTGIPPHRLQQHISLEPDLGKLLQHHEAIGRIGDDDRTLEQRRIRHPQRAYPEMSNAPRTSGRNCFGRTSREAGHSRVPAPPHMISGIIRLLIAPCC